MDRALCLYHFSDPLGQGAGGLFAQATLNLHGQRSFLVWLGLEGRVLFLAACTPDLRLPLLGHLPFFECLPLFRHLLGDIFLFRHIFLLRRPSTSSLPAGRFHARLTSSCFIGACLIGACLIGAFLIGAFLIGACLVGACLVGACLGGICLGGTYLGGTYLGGTCLASA
ncbi:pentapeptide repeat-containing protein [Salinibacter ruber]|uniref:pentapeptide repeat-containing protein n=1 Tax=Salinibacter ruber TaxID=146919 RepID=UPI003C6E3B39